MKRFYLSFIFILFALSAFAQIKITPEGGVMISKSYYYTAGVGARIGVNVRYSFNGKDNGFGLRSGLYYIQRNTTSYSGSDIMYNMPGSSQIKTFFLVHGLEEGVINDVIPEGAELQSINTYYGKVRKDYLQLPVMAEYAWNLSSNLRFHLAAGPYVALGVSGKNKTYTVSWDFEGQPKSTEKSESPFSGGRNRLDVGASMQTGLQVSKFSFILNYDINLYKRDAYGKGNYVSLSLGYTI